MPILKGDRPRPRVALIGDFVEDVVKELGMIFPALRMGKNLGGILSQVNYQEIDLVIIAPGTPLTDVDQRNFEFIANAHVINFSKDFFILPGPSDNTSVQRQKFSSTEEYVIPDLPLKKYNLLEAALVNSDGAKGWTLLNLKVEYRYPNSIPDDKQLEIVFNGALIYDPHTKLPFATMFNRLENNLGVAWLPNKIFKIVPWVALICSEWAILDPTRFPNFGDWTKDFDWMTSEEVNLKIELDNLTKELAKQTNDIKKKISDVENELSNLSLMVNKGRRRLITAQGGDLLEEVALTFKEFGYSVSLVDEELGEGIPKKEDLRIRDPDVENWEAIVEVRGHAKSSGQTSDLNRLPKFANFYRKETGREPDKLIYVVNGQIELSSPLQRKEPFVSAPDDVAAFGELDGLIIWTLDLFKLLKLVKSDDDKSRVRKELRESVGRWVPELIE